MEERNDHTHDENEPERGDEPTGEGSADETRADGIDEPAGETPAEDVPTDGGAVEDEPTAEAPTDEQPTEDEPASDQPAAGQPTEDEPASDQPAAEQPTEDEAAQEEPAVAQAEAATRPEDPRDPQAPAYEPPTQPLGAGAGPGGTGGGGGAGGPTGAGPAGPPPPRRLTRTSDNRVLGGVCAGLGRYFNTDPVFFRIGALVLTLVGGAGVLLYLAAMLLIPKDDSVAATAVDGSSVDGRNRGLVIAGVVLLLLVAWPFLLGVGFVAWGVLIPLAVLVAIGVLVWWLVSGEGPSGDAKDVARRAALGIGLLLLCGLVAFGGAWAAAAGGEAIVAALVIAAGVAIVAGAFLKPVRWLILPALALALSAGAVSAAGIDLDGGVGDREYRPASTVDLRERYELGLGQLTVDLRNTELPPGDTPLELDLGVGSARLIVPDDVCVATTADIGVGYAGVFDTDNEGIDVDYNEFRTPPEGTSRLVVDAEIGVGELLIGRSTSALAQEAGFGGDFDEWESNPDRGTNAACARAGALERG